jgi:hypothetical protein
VSNTPYSIETVSYQKPRYSEGPNDCGFKIIVPYDIKPEKLEKFLFQLREGLRPVAYDEMGHITITVTEQISEIVACGCPVEVSHAGDKRYPYKYIEVIGGYRGWGKGDIIIQNALKPAVDKAFNELIKE